MTSIGNNAPFHDPMKTNIEVLSRRPETAPRGRRPGRVLFRLQREPEHADPRRLRSDWSTPCASVPTTARAGAITTRKSPENECGSIITGPVRGTRLYFMHGRVWWNDPDPSLRSRQHSARPRPAHYFVGCAQRRSST